MTLKKNDIVNLTITSATAEGSGVGRTDDGIAVFVQGSAIGDELKVRILKVKKTYAFGKIEEILVPSKARITPDCENFMKCGGCTWRHISYEEECKIKQQRVEDAVTRIGGLDNVVFKPIISSDNITRYRNKAQYPVGLDRDGNVVTGFYSFHSHRIINCTDCILQPEIFARVIEITKDFIAKTNTEIYDETTGKGRLRHIYIRIGEVSGELMVCYVVNANGLKQEDLLVKMLKSELPQLKSVIINSNREKTNVVLGRKNRTIYGSDHITDTLCGLQFKISPFSFWQINRKQAEKLYGKAKEYANLKSDEILLDLYCGTGTIGLTMADSCKQLIGAEIVEDAVKDANENAKANITLINLLNGETNNFYSIENEINNKAEVNYTIIDIGAKNSISNYYSNMLGSSSKNNLKTIYLGTKNEVKDINYIAEIRGENSNVDIDVQGALKDESKKHFKGTIDFKKGCKKSKGNENEFCILLSDKAKSLALPMLLCTEDDVEGNHSTASGKVDNKDLFYIMSRGLSYKEAIRLIVKAKFNQIIQTIKDEELKEEILNEIDRRID